MKIYLAGERQATAIRYKTEEGLERVWTKYVKRRLFSYYYHGYPGHNYKQSRPGVSIDIDDALASEWDLFLDSGAFTAFTKGVEIPVEQYARYVKWSARAWTACSSLDAIGKGEAAAQKSYDYFRRLRDLGANVQPVFHVREPDHWLQRYIDEDWDYIFIGGMVPETTRWLMMRLDGLWDSILTNEDGTPKVKLHGFGLTDMKLMFRYPWYSVDSSSWLMTGIFGACMFRVGSGVRKVVFSEESPQARKMPGWHYTTLPHKARSEVDAWLEPYGVTAQQLAAHYSYRDVINAAVYQGLEDLGSTHFHMQQPVLFDEAAQ